MRKSDQTSLSVCFLLLVIFAGRTAMAAGTIYEVRLTTVEEVRARTLVEVKDWLARDMKQLVRETGAFLDRCGDQMPILVRSRQRAFIALVWAGDQRTREEAVKFLGPQVKKENAAATRLDVSFPLWEHGSTPARTTLLIRALDMHAPEATAAIRRRILKAQVPEPSKVRIRPRKTVAEMTLAEIKKIAQADDARPREQRSAMRRWLTLGDESAERKLLAIMRNEKLAVSTRCTAASAIAACCRSKGRGGLRRRWHPSQKAALDWLANACVSNVGLGGRPALALLDAGSQAEAEFFRLIDKHDGKELPYPFKYAIAECPDDVFFRHLDRFLILKNEPARSQAHLRIQNTVLPKQVLARLIDHIESQRLDTEGLSRAVALSLANHPPSERGARSLAGTWIDGMLRRRDHELWDYLFRAFLECGLGTPECAAGAARRCLLEEPTAPLACDVLAEAGEPADVLNIWHRIHKNAYRNRKLNPPIKEVELLSQGWLAIIRLTTPSAEQAPRKQEQKGRNN